MIQLTPETDIEDPGITPLGAWALPIYFFWALAIGEAMHIWRLLP